MFVPLRSALALVLILHGTVFVTTPSLAATKPVLRSTDEGTVDWAGRRLDVLGVAPPVVKSAAVSVAPESPETTSRTDAIRKMLSVIHGIPTRGSTTVGDLAAADEELAARLVDLASSYEVVRIRRYSGGGTEVAARLSLEAVLSALRGTPSPATLPAPHPIPAGTGPALVIDASRVRAFVPCLLPSVRDTSGTLRAEAIRGGGWHYAARVADARAELRAPKAPLIRAGAVLEGDATVLLLTSADSARIEKLPGAMEALRSGRVAIVVGKPAKKKKMTK